MEVLLCILLFAANRVWSSEDGTWVVHMHAEVRSLAGYPVVVPCTFSHPRHSHHASVRVRWRLVGSQGTTVLYHCTSKVGSPDCEPGPQQDPRYRLEGDPRLHDLSLRIKDVTLGDSGIYYCGLEVAGRDHKSVEDNLGTRLTVEAPPNILSLRVVASEGLGYTAECRMEGSPPPDIKWLGPDHPLEGSTAGPLNPAGDLVVSQLHDVEPGWQVTCSASNPLGKDQATLYLLHPHTPPPKDGLPPHLLLLLVLSLGSKVAMLVGIGVWLVPKVVLWHN
ncbi:V-set and Ig domain-containing protein isoform X2 [Syngnathoides biaculeatus]|uniref:V-set and Ig domain-containing protein isoform X2 n=1 Tax=Syngnathoides biaculeatus TaxID=300417 RepID=UPI002ADDF9AC|nr:V-set and Ig domain-containing protein isoform X2 [Syngnathoides biaculeatus]